MRTMVRAIAVLSLLTLPAGFLYAGTNPSKARPATSAKAKPEVDHGSARHLSRADASSTPRLEELGRGPLRFEANAGQFASEVRFVSRGMSHTLFLTPNEAVLALPGRPIGPQSPEPFSRLAPQLQHSEGAVARLRLVGANAAPEIIGTDLLPGKSNYLVGNDPTKWRTGIAQYARVRYKDVYPGIDWVYYGNEGQLEYDLIVAPGADPDRITLAMEITRGANTEALRLDENGDLLLASPEDTVRFHRPRVYQEIDGQKQFITASYELKPQGQVGFKLGSYDPSRILVIDPFLSFSTYVGGADTDQGNAVATDTSGNIYVTGLSNSADFPNTVPGRPLNTPPTSNCGTVNCPDAFVIKIDSAGTLQYSTYVGGSGVDSGSAIAVDTNGNAHITGFTGSLDFPAIAGAFQTTANGGTCSNGGNLVACNDAFVVKLDSTGANLLYSSYLGSNGEDDGAGIALDPTSPPASPEFYVVGYTSLALACNFPTTTGAFQTSSANLACTAPGAGTDGFMAKFDPSKTGVNSLVYSTLLGMTLNDFAYAVAVDSSGDVYVVGRTTSTDFPTTAGAFQPAASSGGEDAFLAKLSPGGLGAADLLYSTYIGGSGQFNEALAVAALSGSTSVAFVAGITNSTGLATSGAPQTQLDNTSTPPTCGTSPNTYTCVDAFMMKFDLSKTGSAQKSYSTYIGGRGDDIATSIAVDTSGNAFVAGYTNSANLPTAQPVQATSAGGYDAFITRLDASGARNYATYLGGSDTDVANGIAVDSTSGNVFVAGYTYSTNFLVTPGAMQSANGGIPDVFVAKLGPGATGVVLLSPSTLTFNGEGVGNTSSALTITLRNIGGSSVTGVAVTPTGANPSDYTASATGCATLAGGSSCTISVTFKPGAVGASSASLSISYTGASGSPQTVTLAGTGQDFDFVSQTASQTVTAGGTAAQYTLTVTPQGGFHFDNAVAFSCTGLPTGAACSAPSVTPGATAKNSTLGISTTRRSLAPPMSHRGPLAPGTPEWFGNPWLAAALLLTLLLAAVAGTRQRRAGLVLATGLLVLLTWTACGGGGGTTPPPPTGTPVGTYTITVNAKSGSLTHTASVTLVVQ